MNPGSQIIEDGIEPFLVVGHLERRVLALAALGESMCRAGEAPSYPIVQGQLISREQCANNRSESRVRVMKFCFSETKLCA